MNGEQKGFLLAWLVLCVTFLIIAYVTGEQEIIKTCLIKNNCKEMGLLK